MSYNILVVDDSAIVRSIVKKALSLSGVSIGTVFEAANGEEALATLAAQWIDIVFADINMPKMTGIEMVERMAKDNMLDSVPVVIVSTERNQQQIDDLKKRGVRAYIKKPFRPENIRDTIQEIMSSKGDSHAS
jgi:two-component system, chemotaxis family, chemotaxis protein CheY